VRSGYVPAAFAGVAKPERAGILRTKDASDDWGTQKRPRRATLFLLVPPPCGEGRPEAGVGVVHTVITVDIGIRRTSPPPDTSFRCAHDAPPSPTKGGGIRKKAPNSVFSLPLVGSRRAKLALRVARSAGWGSSVCVFIHRSPHEQPDVRERSRQRPPDIAALIRAIDCAGEARPRPRPKSPRGGAGPPVVTWACGGLGRSTSWDRRSS
jgi:hypothetical protein